MLEKLRLKKPALRLYFYTTNIWKSKVANFRHKWIPILIKKRSRKDVFAINLNSDWLGLGARIVKTLEILKYCDEMNFVPLIQYNYRESNKGHDYFGELFYYKFPIDEKLKKARFTSIRDVDELGWRESYNLKLNLITARSLFDRYLGINVDIMTEVENFISDNFRGRKILGLHYRGTDKIGEAPLIDEDDLIDYVKSVLADDSRLEAIFVSTDDAKIISFLQGAGLPLPVIFRKDVYRSYDGEQIHRKTENSKSTIHRDAIVNMLLLSRCIYLLKTASILSDCSVIFNPTMDVKLMSKPHSETLTWWPCREIIENQKMDERLYS